MKKLILTSNGFENPIIGQEFLKLFNKSSSEIRILFIPTASRTKEELEYVEKSKEELMNLGIIKENIVIYNLDRVMSIQELKDFDSIYVCGGNTFYLLYKVKESKFDERIEEIIEKGIVYIGVSAGTILAGPDIRIAGADKNWDKNDVGLEDFSGLNLTDKIISPHYVPGEEGAIAKYEQENNVKVLRLKDNQALFILDNKEEIFS